ncbi:MAG: glycosyltransferase [Rhodobacteraceae bacterium]|nr:glycosyltransferase [Paracoccaceae bacterium]
MAGPTVLTVIVNWRTPAMTLKAAAAAHAAMAGIAGAITIVDNDSGDGSLESIAAEIARRGWQGRVQAVASGCNGGFGFGNNAGIRAGLPGGVRPDFVYLLNSDAFPRPDAIARLLDHLGAHPETGLAGSFIEGPDGVPHATAFRFPGIGSEFEGAARTGPISRLLAAHAVALPIPEASRRVDWLAGASVMVRRAVLDRVGLFDETFFLYFEETDLCRRAAAAGWPADYVRESVVVHIGSETTGMKRWQRMPRYWFDSRRHYFVKNHGAAYAALATAAHVAGGLIWRLRCLIARRPLRDPPRFLRDLVAHELRALARARPEPAVPCLSPSRRTS